MAKKQQQESNPNPAELERESVELSQPTVVAGNQQWRGDSVEVAPFQRRHLVWGGYAEGGFEEFASEAEKAQGNEDALLRPEDRGILLHGSDEHYAQSPDVTSSGENPVEINDEGEAEQQ